MQKHFTLAMGKIEGLINLWSAPSAMSQALSDGLCVPGFGKSKVLLAVSGGVDSMCMADVFLRQYGPDSFAIAHCNFHLRGEESDGDESMVRAWADGHGVVCHVTDFDTEDLTLLEFNQKTIDDYIEYKDSHMMKYEICGRTCGVVFAERNFSELGNTLCTMHPEIDFVAMIDMTNKTISYRTVKDDINLGEDIATLFGGGGHPKAAGSRLSDEYLDKVIKEIFKND